MIRYRQLLKWCVKLNAITGTYPTTMPSKPAAALFSETLPRKISNSHNATVSGMTNSKHQMLRPHTRPKKNNVFRFGLEADSIDTKRIVKSGIDKRYQE